MATAGAAGAALGATVSGLAGEVGITVTAPQTATAVTAALDTAAGVIVATGTSDAIEAGTGRNPVRDGLLGGNQGAYDTVKGVTHMAAGYGIAMGMPPLAAQRYAEEHMPKEAFGREVIENQNRFPNNPDDFIPAGLTRRTYDTDNGKILKWSDANGRAVYEWDEDIRNGAHYHKIGPDGKTRVPNALGNTHLKPGEKIK